MYWQRTIFKLAIKRDKLAYHMDSNHPFRKTDIQTVRVKRHWWEIIWLDIIAGIFVSVVGGLAVHWIITPHDMRVPPATKEILPTKSPEVTQTPSDSKEGVNASPRATPLPISALPLPSPLPTNVTAKSEDAPKSTEPKPSTVIPSTKSNDVGAPCGIVVLKNGFSIRYSRKETVGSITRFFTGPGFIDVDNEQIEAFETCER